MLQHITYNVLHLDCKCHVFANADPFSNLGSAPALDDMVSHSRSLDYVMSHSQEINQKKHDGITVISCRFKLSHESPATNCGTNLIT